MFVLLYVNLSSFDLSNEWRKVKLTDGTYFLLNIQKQLEQIIGASDDIFDVPSWCDISDIVNAQAFKRMDSDNVKYTLNIYMMLNVDGKTSAFSSKMYHIWPIVASILNFHHSKRDSSET